VTADAGGLVLKIGQRGDPARRLGELSSSSALGRGAAGRAARRRFARSGDPARGRRAIATRVGYMLGMSGVIDIIVPRGGASLIERCSARAASR